MSKKGGTQTEHHWLGELLQAGRHEESTGKSRRMVSQTSADGDLETMETDTPPWTKSHETWYKLRNRRVPQGMHGILRYNQTFLTQEQQALIHVKHL